MSSVRRALIVGINKYNEIPNLKGCVFDAWRMYKVLSTHEDGTLNFECKLITNPEINLENELKQEQQDNPESTFLTDEITASLIKKNLYDLFQDKADVALFYFAGHGAINNLGGYLVTYDYEAYNPGISMPDLITLANNASAEEVIVIIDCCHSGKFGEIPVLGNDNAILREGVSILTATTSSQPAIEDNGGGLFTNVVYEALNGVATDFLGRITVASLYTYVEQAFGAWKQRPLYKSNVRQMVTLRKAKPPLDFSTLRNISKYFEDPNIKFQLDPSYEPSEKNSCPKNTKIFSELQKLRNAGLVKPVGDEHMYYAAMESKSCELTPLGKYYWRLAKMKKFGIEIHQS